MSTPISRVVQESVAASQNDTRTQQKHQKSGPKLSAITQDQLNGRSKKNAAPPIPQRTPLPYPRASFTVISSSQSHPNTFSNDLSPFAPRLGKLVLARAKAPRWNYVYGTFSDISGLEGEDEIIMETPGMLCGASQGIVRHLTRDMVAVARAVDWIHVPFEDFLEHNTPVPILHPAPLPLHTHLNHPPTRHIISISLRDPGNNQQMPANTNAYVQAKTVRGVRKVTINDWLAWCTAIRPDMIWAFVDNPKTLLVGSDDAEAVAIELIPGEGRQISQKRITRSLDRTIGWLEKLMGGLRLAQQQQQPEQLDGPERPPIIVPLIGGCDRRARAEFAHNLTEKLDKNDQKETGLQRIDDGIFGYAIEMVDLPTNQYHAPPPPPSSSSISNSEDESDSSEIEEPDAESQAANETTQPRSIRDKLTGLVRASLKPLPNHKPRIAHTATSPHAVLRLILDCGIDLFDAVWAQRASDYGIALSFQFPVPPSPPGPEGKGKTKDTRPEFDNVGSKQQIGENLFEDRYAEDISPVGDLETSWPCAPTSGPEPILHSTLDDKQWSQTTEPSKPFTRAYIHHLLRTHEMSSHVLLQLHNLAVADRFFQNIRTLLRSSDSDGDGEKKLRAEVIRFYETYDIPTRLYEEAKNQWKEVDTSRGKGRLKREREAAAVAEAEAAAAAQATTEVGETASAAGGIMTQAAVGEALEDVS